MAQRYFRVTTTGQWCRGKHGTSATHFPDDGQEFANRYAMACGLQPGALEVIDLPDDAADPRDGDTETWLGELPPPPPTPEHRKGVLEGSLRSRLRALCSSVDRLADDHRKRVVYFPQLPLSDEDMERIAAESARAWDEKVRHHGTGTAALRAYMDEMAAPFDVVEAIAVNLRHIDRHLEFLMPICDWNDDSRNLARRFRDAYERERLKDLRDLCEHAVNYILDKDSHRIQLGIPASACEPSINYSSTQEGELVRIGTFGQTFGVKEAVEAARELYTTRWHEGTSGRWLEIG